MIFYTADTHFGFLPIIRKTARPFGSIREMDETLIANWNRTVGNDDTVYIVGDFAYDRGRVPALYFERLNGRKHLIRGNHDASLDYQEDFFRYCESVTDLCEIDDGDDHVILCHYPFVHNKRSYMIHGHLHNSRGVGYALLRQMPHVLNAGVDINFFRPVTLQELIRNNELYYSEEHPELFPDPNDPANWTELPEAAGIDIDWWENEHFRPYKDKTVDFRPLPVPPVS